ncbi:MAG: DUF2007 domain-containing protein [Thermodesulfobacteriota bacterium]
MSGNLITVQSYSTPLDAHMAKSRLDAAGIYAVIVDEHTVTMNWLLSNAVGGVKVKVLEEDLQDARLVLELNSLDEPEASEVHECWGACPICSSLDVEYFTDKRGPFLSWLFLGFLAFPAGKKLKCNGCGHIWKYKKR